MEIDLSDIPIGFAETSKELEMLKSAKIYKELNNINRSFTKIITSMPIYNILINHDYFEPIVLDKDFYGEVEVGRIGAYKVFIDLAMTDNIIKLSFDTQQSRDNKLSSILDEVEIKKDLKIKVLNCD